VDAGCVIILFPWSAIFVSIKNASEVVALNRLCFQMFLSLFACVSLSLHQTGLYVEKKGPEEKKEQSPPAKPVEAVKKQEVPAMERAPVQPPLRRRGAARAAPRHRRDRGDHRNFLRASDFRRYIQRYLEIKQHYGKATESMTRFFDDQFTANKYLSAATRRWRKDNRQIFGFYLKLTSLYLGCWK
jgi:hypothetical protein